MKITMKWLFSLTLLQLFAILSTAQWNRIYDVPVVVGDTAIFNPWAGGINSAQISTFDANLDGLQDIFVFDRIGSRISIFINMDGTPGAMRYRYTQEYNHLFPSTLRHWVFLRDMNCDGIVSVGDIAGFVLALTDPAGYAAAFPACDINNGDINGDSVVSVGDIAAFVALVTGG